jgi:hypothetical protein
MEAKADYVLDVFLLITTLTQIHTFTRGGEDNEFSK